MRTTILIAAVSMFILCSCADDDPTGPVQSLEGTWNLIGYSDHGVAGVTAGTVTFGSDGHFVVAGTVTYPGEPTDALDVAGTYEVHGNTVSLTASDNTGIWSVAFSGDRAVLALVGSDPPTTMTLEK